MTTLSNLPPCKSSKKIMDIVLGLNETDHVEDMAQHLTNQVFSDFKESIVLTRIFITQPYKSLPSDITGFVEELGKATNVLDQITPNTQIMALAGTSGRERDWCSRLSSGGHKGIPLVSSDFISAVPMMMGMIQQAFGSLSWLDKKDIGDILRITGNTDGDFFIQNAPQEVDAQNRKIIAAQDFVNAEGVGTVIGQLSGYVGGSIAVWLTFTNEKLPEYYRSMFRPALGAFCARTADKVIDHHIFRS